MNTEIEVSSFEKEEIKILDNYFNSRLFSKEALDLSKNLLKDPKNVCGLYIKYINDYKNHFYNKAHLKDDVRLFIEKVDTDIKPYNYSITKGYKYFLKDSKIQNINLSNIKKEYIPILNLHTNFIYDPSIIYDSEFDLMKFSNDQIAHIHTVEGDYFDKKVIDNIFNKFQNIEVYFFHNYNYNEIIDYIFEVMNNTNYSGKINFNIYSPKISYIHSKICGMNNNKADVTISLYEYISSTVECTDVNHSYEFNMVNFKNDLNHLSEVLDNKKYKLHISYEMMYDYDKHKTIHFDIIKDLIVRNRLNSFKMIDCEFGKRKIKNRSDYIKLIS